jgi:hypothetical protein
MLRSFDLSRSRLQTVRRSLTGDGGELDSNGKGDHGG